ncbi:MAG: immunoglobulin domain-containing protein [Verrucomicrobiota bacterium]
MIQAAEQRVLPKPASITRTQTVLSVALKALVCVFVFAQSVLATPFIERSPKSVTVPVGAPVTLTVSATGTGPLTYQWRKAAPVVTLADAVTPSAEAWYGAESPQGVAADGAGNVYVAYLDDDKIRKITKAGKASILPGSGTEGSADRMGSDATFSSLAGIAVDGSGNVFVTDRSHKIRKITSSTNISGATSATYSIEAASIDNMAIYECVVPDRFSTIVSSAVSVTVDSTPPVIGPLSHLQVTVPRGRSTTVSYPAITVTDNAGTPTITFSPASGSRFEMGDSTVTVTATDSAGNTATGTFTVTVKADPPPSIDGPFSPLVLYTDDLVELPNYAAQAVTKENVAGGITQIPAAGTLVSPGSLKVILSGLNETGNWASISLGIEVRQFPQIINQPKPVKVWNEANRSFTVEAQGYGELRYQWKKNGVPIPNATGSTLDLITVTSDAQGIYTVVVSNSLGSVESTAGQLSFVDRTLLDGLYQGLLIPKKTTSAESIYPGRLTIALAGTGLFSGKLDYRGMTYRFSGTLGSHLLYQKQITRAGQSNLEISLVFDADALTLSATVSETDNWIESTTLMVAQPDYSARSRAPQSGRYTAVFNPTNTAGDVPKTSGYVSVEVNPLGVVGVLGKLPDGAVLTGTAILQHDGSAAYYEPLYSPTPRGAGYLAGSLSFTPNAGTQAVLGQLHWHKPYQKGADLWTDLFDQRLEAEGSAYNIVKGKTIVWDNTEKLQFTADSLSGTNVEMKLENGTDFIVTQPGRSKVTLTLQKVTGLMSGSIVDTRTRTRRPLTGVVLQAQKEARGFYLWKNDTGEWSLSKPGN